MKRTLLLCLLVGCSSSAKVPDPSNGLVDSSPSSEVGDATLSEVDVTDGATAALDSPDSVTSETTDTFIVDTTEDATSAWDPLPVVEKAKIGSGPFKGGFLVGPGGYLNWYFANLGLLPFVERIPDEVRAYLDLYLSRLEVDSSIRDVTFSSTVDPGAGSFTLRDQDSDDSYAATFLSLAVRYRRVTKNAAWWTANVVKLKSVADRNLVASQQTNGLVHVFQSLAKFPISYTEDNCEAYKGLHDFALLLAELGDADAAKYSGAADKIAAAVDSTMWLDTTKAFAVAWNGATNPLGTAFYPDAVTQGFPQAYALPGSTAHRDLAWGWFETTAPGWWTGKYDKSPFMILGYVAALRGDSARALAQQATFRAISDPSYVHIHDLGFYDRITRLLGKGEVL